jgi:hypothetical protein
MALVDNRTAIDVFNSTLSTGDYLATSSAAIDTEVFYQGDRSIAENMNNSARAVVFNAGSPQDWSNNIFYVLINCGVVGNLTSKATGGFRIRFCGGANEDANYFEVYVGGSDSWPASFAGGWTMFIVDVEEARSQAVTNGWTNGTVPATTAIQCVGYVGITTGMIRTNDNTWLNGIWRLPSGTPGILIEEQNTGSVDWSFADVLSTADANFWGSFRQAAGGAYVCNVPIRFGNGTDSLTHGFTDTNSTLLWEDSEYIVDGFYGLDVIGSATNTVNVTWGVKSGTGADATGAQGITIQSNAGQTGTRWYLDVNDTNIDSFSALGCSFINGQIFSLDQSNVEIISSQFINCNEAIQSLGANSSLWQRNSVIDANTADGVAFLKTVDLDNIKYSTFEFSDGHAIEITTLGSALTGETFLGNNFTGYSSTTNSTDAAIYNNSGQSVTINVTGGNLVNTSYRNGTSASTTINNNVAITVTNMKDNTEVRVFLTSSIDTTPPYTAPTELAGIENATAGTTDARTFTFSVASNTGITIRTFNENWIADDITITPTSSQEVQVAQRRDRVFSNP